ncbi:MAG: hypothetical protein R6X02_35985 [Enhygromyxa sp.]
MLDRPAAWWASAALVLAAASSCAEPPSYLVRWKLVDSEGQVTELSSVKQCADVGISKVRVTTRRGSVVVDAQEYPCFPGAFERGEGVEVPALPPGEYEVQVEGLRRTGEPWVCEAEDEAEPCVAFAQSTVIVAEDALPELEVELLQPPECDDGIDNDRDGRVDGKDPGCILDPSGSESADAGVALFQTSVSFLGSAAVKPANVSVQMIRLEVDGELLSQVPAFELDTSQWPFRLPLVSATYDPGEYLFSIYAADAAGNPLTSAHEVPLIVDQDYAGYVVGQFDFGSEQFLEPIVQPFAVIINLALDQLGELTSTCALGGVAGVGLDRMWFRVTDEDGQPLDAATASLTAMAGQLTPVDEADGWISFECPTAMLRSAELPWGRYALEIEGRIGDAVCFTSDGPLDLAPVPSGQASAQSFSLQRIVDERGVPPAGCEECFGPDDCSGQVCEAGICKDIQP